MISTFLYYLFAKGFQISLSCARFFSKKAKRAYEGRKNWKQNPEYSSPKDKKVLWMHVSSLGEFEQGRPVLELFRKIHPDWHIALTFFSPSGYEIRKNYPTVDTVLYLPLDSPSNARIFLKKIKPDIAVFVKYDFWFYFLTELQKQPVPTLLIAAKFRASQPFFKPWGSLWRKMLHCFDVISTQDAHSIGLLHNVGYAAASQDGDPRIDRVLEIRDEHFSDEKLVAFSAEARVIIVGSSWYSDVEILNEDIIFSNKYKLLIAPHELNEQAYTTIQQKFPTALRYTQTNTADIAQSSVLILDTMGMLNKVYRYGHIAYIGGGFGSGIHNILEPAAYGLPIFFGPNYTKFEEARQLVATQGAFVVKTQKDLSRGIERLEDPHFYKKTQQTIQHYLAKNKGASHKIIERIQRIIEE